MSWADKQLKKHKIHKMVEQAMNTEKYKEARKIDQQQATLRALCRFCFLTCEYLELKHGYKKKGLQNFLKFAKARVVEIGEEESGFDDDEKYYLENYNFDVLGALGLEIEKGEQE
ncbi:MAG: hypothetical protein IJ471_01415 [Eubacterium sp.]|nr:hypothetical protein [Eubacterium sp.]